MYIWGLANNRSRRTDHLCTPGTRKLGSSGGDGDIGLAMVKSAELIHRASQDSSRAQLVVLWTCNTKRWNAGNKTKKSCIDGIWKGANCWDVDDMHTRRDKRHTHTWRMEMSFGLKVVRSARQEVRVEPMRCYRAENGVRVVWMRARWVWESERKNLEGWYWKVIAYQRIFQKQKKHQIRMMLRKIACISFTRMCLKKVLRKTIIRLLSKNDIAELNRRETLRNIERPRHRSWTVML